MKGTLQYGITEALVKPGQSMAFPWYFLSVLLGSCLEGVKRADI
jgi:hypothetical protein